VLAADGRTVDSADNGAEGLDKVTSDWFDVVITDRAMPEMSGDQFAAAVKRIAHRHAHRLRRADGRSW
jgi:YesN/AraC family two-component response regulator